MSLKLEQFLSALDEIAPPQLAEAWDNCDMQIDVSGGSVEKILICLEITDAVIDEAIRTGADLIVSHHPLIFQPINKVDNNTIIGRYISRLIQHRVSVYSAHTSFDSVWGGNNDDLAGLLGLEGIVSLDGDNHQSGGGLGRIGVYQPQKRLGEIVTLVKTKLRITDPIKVVGESDRLIGRIAVCAGSGADALDDVRDKGCDLLITGDVKHRHGLSARETGIALIDAGHFQTEIIFVANMAAKLRNMLGNSVEIEESVVDRDPFVML